MDYYEKPHLIHANYNDDKKQTSIEINVTCVAYPTEVLSVDSSKVSPPPEALQRIADEKAEAEKIYKHITPERYWNKPYIRPIDSITTSEYGSARTYNGVLKSYHTGVDFRAKTPLPIIATNDGVVVLVKERYYSGGTIIIDHGEGVYSCYFHMSQFDVKVGDPVIQGQIIGLSGATGRITGPHLHFGFMVQGVQTDPIEFMTQINQLFEPKEPINLSSAQPTQNRPIR
jgi:murein DD-endopeptidase MepM/ murein hydrolase activator NlpD